VQDLGIEIDHLGQVSVVRMRLTGVGVIPVAMTVATTMTMTVRLGLLCRVAHANEPTAILP
jgi:hypothetical protein